MNAFLSFLEKLLTVIFSVGFGILIIVGLIHYGGDSSEQSDLWRQVKKKNSIESYLAYLRECPACPHAGEAKTRMAELLQGRGLVARLDAGHLPERVGIGLPVFSADGQTILAAGSSGPSLWDANSGQHLARAGRGFSMQDPRSLQSLAFAPDGQQIAAGTSGAETGRLLVWNVRSGDLVAERLVEGYDVKAVQFAPEGSLLGWLAQGPLGIWEPATGKFLRATHEGASALAFFRNPQSGRLWLLSASGREVWSWDAQTLELLRQVRIDSDRELLGLSGDGHLIAYAKGPTVELWETRSALAVATWADHDDDVVSFCRDSRGGRVVVGTRAGTLYLWDSVSRELLGKAPAHDGPVERLACSGHGRAVSTGWDGVKVWDLDKLGKSKYPVRDR